MSLPKLIWDEWNREHIKKHNITVDEVEEAYILYELVARTRKGRSEIISRIRNGRMITVFVSYERQPGPYVVSARDSSKKERSIYYENEKKG